MRTASLRPHEVPSRTDVLLHMVESSRQEEGPLVQIEVFLLSLFSRTREAVGVLLHNNPATEHSLKDEMSDADVDAHLAELKRQGELRRDLLHVGVFWMELGLVLENVNIYRFSLRALPNAATVLDKVTDVLTLIKGLQNLLSNTLPGTRYLEMLKTELAR